MKNLVDKLRNKHKTISTMESCTGGCLASEITNIEHSSEVIKYSAVTYSNEFKIKMGVDSNIIDKYTVYSIETAKAMSKAISDYTNSNYGIGITGKLNRIDENNLCGQNNLVFVGIYDKDNDKYYTLSIEVLDQSRSLNKKLIVDNVVKFLNNIV